MSPFSGDAPRGPPAPLAPAFSAADARWQAVRERDARADGHFVFSVTTTGVYCRPSCAARPARREHVEFHATPADAERAGFRPCKRCRPDLPPRAERDAALVAAACRTIEAAEEAPRLAELAAQAALRADLAARFPHARLTEPDPAFADWVAAVVRFVDDPAGAEGLGLPLDVRGTAFQRRVWEALRQIPPGQT